MKEELLSVGIDIGTTTTQVIFSKIWVQNIASTFLVPEVKITEKEIIYKSEIYFTPLLSPEKIDLEKLKVIIAKEYEKTGIDKRAISTGAIIITGETARKENAEEVLNNLSDFAGDFVVATAGPDLEAILAGYGSGASEISKKYTARVTNFDIGGGTTNTASFWEGEVIDSYALDIGGRLIQLNNEGRITYISEKIVSVISSLGLSIKVGELPALETLKKLTDTLADMLLRISKNGYLKPFMEELFIIHKNKGINSDMLMFSGGVAEFIYSDHNINTISDVNSFGDIGPLLGYSIRMACEREKIKLFEPKEKIRATVIGAGSHSIKISGSTIVYEEDILPIKNIPIIKLSNAYEKLEDLHFKISEKLKAYRTSVVAIAFKGPISPSYIEVKSMANSITFALSESSNPIIVIVENDFSKALGQCINNIVRNSKKVICLDKIKVDNGDYIDIGKPIAGVIPVVVKTIIFTN